MARWKLTEKHYLNVPGTRWELQQVDRSTGRQVRKSFEVPRYFDPEDESDWNRREGFDGYISVCHEGKGHEDGRDIVFLGDPTPGMLPLDAEAKALSGKFAWTPTQGVDQESQDNSFQNKLLLGLIDQMADIQTKATAAPQVEGFEKLISTMTAMMAQQNQLLMALAAKSGIADPAPPLPEAEPPTEEEIIQSAEVSAAAAAASDRAAKAALARTSLRR